jgi:hypothetical protein
LHKLGFFFVLILVCTTDCFTSKREMDRSDIKIKLQVICDEFEEVFTYPTPLSERKDLLSLLGELSLKESPSIRFISTNTTEEIMEINGRRTSWKEGWNIYLNGELVSPQELKRGLKVYEKDKILIRLEKIERVFGKPTKHETNGEGE